MTDLTLIVAYDACHGIGINNQLAWHIPEDLARFKRITTGHTIVMGRKTYESIGKPLPNRRNLVLTHQTDWHADGVEVVHQLDQALQLIGDEPAFVIGGAQLYRQMLPLCRRMLVTEIHHEVHCDAFFPSFDRSEWNETERETHHSDKNDFDFSFVTYVRY